MPSGRSAGEASTATRSEDGNDAEDGGAGAGCSAMAAIKDSKEKNRQVRRMLSRTFCTCRRPSGVFSQGWWRARCPLYRALPSLHVSRVCREDQIPSRCLALLCTCEEVAWRDAQTSKACPIYVFPSPEILWGNSAVG